MKDKEYDLARQATYIEDEIKDKIEDKDLKFTTAEDYMKDMEAVWVTLPNKGIKE